MKAVHPDLAALKATTRGLIDACGGSEACSVLLQKSGSLIRSYANPNNPERCMPLDDVIALERFCGRAIVSAWGAERHRSDPDRVRRAPEPADMSRIAKETSDALKAKADAWSDGKFCAEDRRAVSKELREAIDALREILECVEEGE